MAMRSLACECIGQVLQERQGVEQRSCREIWTGGDARSTSLTQFWGGCEGRMRNFKVLSGVFRRPGIALTRCISALISSEQSPSSLLRSPFSHSPSRRGSTRGYYLRLGEGQSIRKCEGEEETCPSYSEHQF